MVDTSVYFDKPSDVRQSNFFHNPLYHLLCIGAAGLIIYSNTFSVPFQFDDIPNIVENYRLRDMGTFWPPEGTRWFGMLTLGLNYQAGKLDTAWYHGVNLLIHCINALLVYYMVILTFRTPHFTVSGGRELARYTALLAGLVFAVHPVQTQAVTYIVQRVASLATMLYLLSLIMYIRARLIQHSALNAQHSAKTGKKINLKIILSCLAAVISSVLAMKTKETAFTLPVMAVVYEVIFFTGSFRKRFLYLIPVLATLVVIPLAVLDMDKPVGEIMGDVSDVTTVGTSMTRAEYLMTEIRVIVTYLRLLILPINQNLDYDYPVYHSLMNPGVLAPVLLLGVCGTAVFMLYRRAKKGEYGLRLVIFGTAWFFIALSVESSIIPIRDVIFEHRVYLPSAGAFVAASAVICMITDRLKDRRIEAVTAVCTTLLVLMVFSAAAHERNAVWSDEVRLWEDVVKKSPWKSRAHNNIGNVYTNEGLLDKAIEHLKTAININPYYADSHNHLGSAYFNKNMIDEAIKEYATALELYPGYAKAHYNIGVAYYKKGLTDKAVEHYETAIHFNKYDARAHNNLGIIYFSKGMVDKAIGHYENALLINPDNAIAHNNLGYIYFRQGEIEKARKAFETALMLDSSIFQSRSLLDYINKQYDRPY